MNWIISILNISLLIFIPACAAGLGNFPAKHVYIADVTNRICAKYKIIDSENLKFSLESEAPLAPKGDCDRMVGFHRDEFNTVKNWVRDVIDELKKKAQEIVKQVNNRI